MSQKVAVVTGANKGIGLALVKGLCQRYGGIVYLTSRDEARGRVAVAELNGIGLRPEYHQLDVTDRHSVQKFAEHLSREHGGIDILINNAAVANNCELFNTFEQNKAIIDINYRSINNIHELIFPIIRTNGRVLNISSDAGHLSNVRDRHWIRRLADPDLTARDVNDFVDWFLAGNESGTFDNASLADDGTMAAYRVSKVALSAITLVHQRELESRNISVNSMHPGLVRTDMTNGFGFYSTDEAAETPLYLVLDAPQDLKGAYVWFDRRVLDWCDAEADYYPKCSTLFARPCASA